MGKRGRRRKASDSDDDFEEGPSKSTQHGKYKHRDTLDIKLVIDQDEIDADKTNSPCWKTAYAGVPGKPPRRLCVICGYFANYKCLPCANRRIEPIDTYYCSLRCQEIHNDTNCGKVIHFTQW